MLVLFSICRSTCFSFLIKCVFWRHTHYLEVSQTILIIWKNVCISSTSVPLIQTELFDNVIQLNLWVKIIQVWLVLICLFFKHKTFWISVYSYIWCFFLNGWNNNPTASQFKSLEIFRKLMARCGVVKSCRGNVTAQDETESLPAVVNISLNCISCRYVLCSRRRRSSIPVCWHSCPSTWPQLPSRPLWWSCGQRSYGHLR